ncbi:hypothetical protein ACNKHO_06235 [Shigella flexneri]
MLVLLCFDLLGEGFEVALPRVIDTLIRLRHRRGRRSACLATGVQKFPRVSDEQ